MLCPARVGPKTVMVKRNVVPGRESMETTISCSRKAAGVRKTLCHGVGDELVGKELFGKKWTDSSWELSEYASGSGGGVEQRARS